MTSNSSDPAPSLASQGRGASVAPPGGQVAAASEPAAKPSAQTESAPAAKQAVVVIHGIGEQQPMDTINNFVRAVWENNADIARPLTPKEIAAGATPNLTEVWSKPDGATGSLELRRITTRASRKSNTPPGTFPGGLRTDFFELYWADLSAGSTWSQIEDWIKGLLLRNPVTRVPPDVRGAWLLLWALCLAVITLAVATVLPDTATVTSFRLWDFPPLKWLAGIQAWQLGAATAVLGLLTRRYVVPYVGRVVRYTRATPDNIAARKEIRARGLALLRELHNGRYDRIILVGHSLGSILAYDLLTYFWAERSGAHLIKQWADVGAAAKSKEFEALCKLSQAADALTADASKAEDFQDAQTKLGHLLRKREEPDDRWLITDLVTLGSPLTHAEFLMATSEEDLQKRIDERQYPTSPPAGESEDVEVTEKAFAAGLTTDPKRRRFFCFPVVGRDGFWELDHAAPFAVVRWTNIYDPACLVFWGDIISGPLAPVFGSGVNDVNLAQKSGRKCRLFTHTKYWQDDGSGTTPERIKQLREALDLIGDKRLL